MDIDENTSFGLPTEDSVFEEIAKGEQKIKVSTVSRRYGKITTLVSGFDKNFDIKGTAKRLKSELAAEISAVLAFAAIQNNDRVGLIIFTDRIEKFIE